jgi:hypothetical protein
MQLRRRSMAAGDGVAAPAASGVIPLRMGIDGNRHFSRSGGKSYSPLMRALGSLPPEAICVGPGPFLFSHRACYLFPLVRAGFKLRVFIRFYCTCLFFYTMISASGFLFLFFVLFWW